MNESENGKDYTSKDENNQEIFIPVDKKTDQLDRRNFIKALHLGKMLSKFNSKKRDSGSFMIESFKVRKGQTLEDEIDKNDLGRNIAKFIGGLGHNISQIGKNNHNNQEMRRKNSKDDKSPNLLEAVGDFTSNILQIGNNKQKEVNKKHNEEDFNLFVVVGDFTKNVLRIGKKDNDEIDVTEPSICSVRSIILNEDEEWAKFQEEIKEHGIAEDESVTEAFENYLSMREDEEAIDKCLSVYQKTDDIISDAIVFLSIE